MKLKTNPTSKAYCFAFVEGLTVTVVIDQDAEKRTVRVTTDHDPATDPRPYVLMVDGRTVPFGSNFGDGQGGGGSGHLGGGVTAYQPVESGGTTEGATFLPR